MQAYLTKKATTTAYVEDLTVTEYFYFIHSRVDIVF